RGQRGSQRWLPHCLIGLLLQTMESTLKAQAGPRVSSLGTITQRGARVSRWRFCTRYERAKSRRCPSRMYPHLRDKSSGGCWNRICWPSKFDIRLSYPFSEEFHLEECSCSLVVPNSCGRLRVPFTPRIYNSIPSRCSPSRHILSIEVKPP